MNWCLHLILKQSADLNWWHSVTMILRHIHDISRQSIETSWSIFKGEVTYRLFFGHTSSADSLSLLFVCGVCVYGHVCSPVHTHVEARSSVACLSMLYHTFFFESYLLMNPQCPCLARLTDQAVSQTLLLLPSSIETIGACQHTLLCKRVLEIWTWVLMCYKPQHYTVIAQPSCSWAICLSEPRI